MPSPARNSSPPDERSLEALLSAPDEATTEALAALDGDIIVLGAGGKMGPTVARMARRAIPDTSRRVIAVSRFSNEAAATDLEACGVDVVRANLADPRDVARLPHAANVLWMAGQKFGTTGDPVGTWTHNVVASMYAAERYEASRIVCFSTGNVYGRSPVADGGSGESAALAPDGEYAAACIGRERVFQSITSRTKAELLLFRLFYACDLRYGVVTDIALKVLRGEPVSLAIGHVNVIWQADANRLALRALGCATQPATALNATGPIVSVRDIAECIGRIAGVAPRFEATERSDALIANTERLVKLLPFTALPLETLCVWTVEWIRQGGRLLNKPTSFEKRDGRF